MSTEPRLPASLRPETLPILNFHGLDFSGSSYRYGPEEASYTLPLKVFLTALDALAAAGRTTLSLSDLDGWLTGRIAGRAVMLTFDDGLLSHLECAAPALRRRNMKAFFFVPPALLGSPGHLSHAQFRKLGAWFDIGSHGLRHRPLTSLSQEDLRAEAEDSKHILEDAIGRRIDAFAVPYGFYNRRVKHALRRAGYRFVFTSRYALNPRTADRLDLGRIALRRGFDPNSLERILRGKLGLARWTEALKDTARSRLSPSVYGRLAALKAGV